MAEEFIRTLLLDRLKRLQLIRRMKWERTETKLGWLGLALLITGWRLPKVDALQPVLEVAPWAPLALIGLGTTLVGYFFYRAWQYIYSPLDIPAITGPVVRGASAFSPEDGEIFKKLGRQEELGKLRDWILDPQVPAVVVMGRSGAGKTSLLRAGVQNLVGLNVAYWEAVTFFSAERFRESIKKQFGGDSSSDSRKVLLIDQAEQLGSDRDIFELLGQHLLSDPPYSTTWIVAMRREYLPDWFEWSEEQLTDQVVNRVKILPVKDFTAKKAKEVFSILAEEAGLTVKEEVLREVIDSVIEEDRVSPVDLAIALQVLVRHPKQAEDPKFLLSIGGHSAMLTRYLEGELEIFDHGVRQEIYRALLELVDLETDRRKADGSTLQELEQAARPEASQTFSQVIRRLALPGVRVLEPLEDRFRLMHERFIPAVRRLAGDVMTIAEKASRLLTRRYGIWATEGKSKQYLVKGAELRQLESELHRIEWGKDRGAKERFFDLSVQQRRWRRAYVSVALVITLVAAGFAFQWWQVEKARRQMRVWRLPVGFYELLPQVKSLSLVDIWVDDLSWLKRAERLEQLELSPSLLRDLGQLPDGLSHLSLDLTNSQIPNLLDIPDGISRLSLDLTFSQITSLPEIPDGLSQLSLNLTGSQITSLPEIPDGLSQLSLNLSSSQITSLPEIPDGLSQLSLKLSNSKITSLPEVPDGLSHLSIDITSSQITSLPKIPDGLSHLSLKLSRLQIASLPEIPDGLSHLSIDLTGSPIDNLPTAHSDQAQLFLALAGSRFTNLPEIPDGLAQLSLALAGYQINRLTEIPSGLSHLSLNLRRSQVTNLRKLPDGLSHLFLDLSSPHVTNLPKIPDGLSQLSIKLSHSKILTLPEIPAGLSQFSLVLEYTIVTSLPEIPDGLSELSLDLSNSLVTGLPEIPDGLSKLSLVLSNSQITSLPEIPDGLSQLSLDLSDSQITNLEAIPNKSDLELHLKF